MGEKRPFRRWAETIVAACDRVLDDLASETQQGTYRRELALEVASLRLRMLSKLSGEPGEPPDAACEPI